MKRVLIVLLLMGILGASLSAQTPLRVITRPKIPTQDVLDRLNLGFGWHARIPLDSPRDHLVSLQILPRGAGTAIKTEIVAQTARGNIYLFDGETGALRWNTPVGIAYSPVHPVTYNSQSIILSRRDRFYVLNRDTGTQRVFKKSPNGERTFGYPLDRLPSAAPAANEFMVVFPFFDRVSAFALPDFEKLAIAREKEPEILAEEREGSVQPFSAWEYFDPTMKLSTPPIVTPSQVAITVPSGKILSLALGQARERVRFDFRTLGGINAAMGSNDDFGYVGSDDYFLYALNLDLDRLEWRFASGAPIVRKPLVNDADVFVFSRGRGLFRVFRFTGADFWLEPAAENFLAAHYFKDAKNVFKIDSQGRAVAKYVYVTDRHGKLLILDGDRGGVLGQFDMSDWQTTLANEWTDRIYFANNDGQILALHPRDSRLPQINKSIHVPVKASAPRAPVPDAPPPPPPAPKDDEKKVDKMGSLAPQGRPLAELRAWSTATLFAAPIIAGDDRIMLAS